MEIKKNKVGEELLFIRHIVADFIYLFFLKKKNIIIYKTCPKYRTKREKKAKKGGAKNDARRAKNDALGAKNAPLGQDLTPRGKSCPPKLTV